jgi:hypothetical protein
MPTQLKFHRKFDFAALPRDWKVLRCAVDWNGNPLLLVQEGKPAAPTSNVSMEARVAWLNAPPKAHHLIYWDGASQCSVTFEQSTGLTTLHVQPFHDGWLLCESRGGRAAAYNRAGRLERILDLGDASKDVQTTSDGKIWVSYFDEGVYGGGIGQHGVVCFDSRTGAIFKYSDFAEQHELPLIDDCYAMNVVGDDEVWLSYYSDFPLVSIKTFKLLRVWKEFGCIQSGFAIFEGAVVFPKCYTRIHGANPQLQRRTLSDLPQTAPVEAVDDGGKTIEGHFNAAGRGSHFYLWTETALYQMTAV